MKIGFVALGFPPDVGGTERYNEEYARRLAARGHEVKVLTWVSEAGDASAWDSAQPFSVTRLPYLRHRKLISPAGIADNLRSWKPDVIFVSRGSRMMQEVIAAAAPIAPLVLSIHELREKHKGLNFFNRWRIRRRYGLHLTARVTVNSGDTGSRLLALGWPAEKLDTVYPGADLSRFLPDREAGAALREKRAWGERPILLTVARLAANKGHELVIEALPELRSEHPELRYVIVGQGPMRAELEARAKALNVSDMVEFTGLVDDVLPYYQACDVYAMPSRPQNERANAGEGFGIAYVEAGACARAVLASSSGGGAEIVEDGVTGRLVDPRTKGSVARALKELLRDPKARELMGQAARERVARYDWACGVESLERALSQACSR